MAKPKPQVSTKSKSKLSEKKLTKTKSPATIKKKTFYTGKSKKTTKAIEKITKVTAKTKDVAKNNGITDAIAVALSKSTKRRQRRILAKSKKKDEKTKTEETNGSISKSDDKKNDGKSKTVVDIKKKKKKSKKDMQMKKADSDGDKKKSGSNNISKDSSDKSISKSNKVDKNKSTTKSKNKELVSAAKTSSVNSNNNEKGAADNDNASTSSKKKNKKRKKKSKSKSKDADSDKPKEGDATKSSDKPTNSLISNATNSNGAANDTNKTNSDSVKATENGVDKTTSTKASKKRKGPKTFSGSSNWALLCSQELKTDPTVRKTHEVKSSKEDEEEPPAKKAKPEIWFDDVDESLLMETSDDKDESESQVVKSNSKSLVKEQSFEGKTKCIGMDCEMVGTGKDGEESILARVSLVNIYGHCLYDKYVLPREKVTDYRTPVSGVTRELVAEKGEPFLKVQQEVSDIIKDGVLVGHALHNDLKVLFLSHPHKRIRDTSVYKPFRELFNGQRPSLKKLTEKLLGVKVQEGEHSSVEDAQAAMRLYTMHRRKWEKELKELYRLVKKKKEKQKKKEMRDEEDFES